MKRLLSLLLYVAIVIAFLMAIATWKSLFSKVDISDEGIEIFIPHGTSYEDVKDTLRNHQLLVNETAFDLLARRKRYPDNIKPGHYVITDRMSYNDMMNLLRAGNQVPVRITFNNIRTIPELAGKLARQIEIDSLSIVSFLRDESNYREDGFRAETIISLFIPDTYEVYWTVSASELYEKMLSEYKLFWNEQRRSKAQAVGLTTFEVSTLASIIDDEVNKADEKPTIAGVYLNRLKRNMPLQACPTIKFALNDFSGYHHFSTTLREHTNYANRYQEELDKRKIFN